MFYNKYAMKTTRVLFALSLLGILSLTSCTKGQIIPNPSDPGEEEVEEYEVIETFAKRMPAEFEPTSSVIMCYPNNMPLSVYKEIAKDNKILLLVNPNYVSRKTEAQNAFVEAGIDTSNVTFLDMNIDDDYYYWARDFSPFFTFKDTKLSITDFNYNRPQRVNQNKVPKKLSNILEMDYTLMDITHTGGNLMQDGRGTAFSDDLVIEENNNNQSKVRSEMKEGTGTDNYVITIDPQGDYIAHIDCWGKIVAPDKIIVARLPQNNPRYQYYEEVANQLANLKCAYGYNYRIYRVDEPGGYTIAPYTNSLILNNNVYIPMGENATYNTNAINVYKEALPGYNVVGVEGFDFDDSLCFLNTDALHCRTHEIPDDDMMFIDCREVLRGEVSLKDSYLVKANVVSYADKEIDYVKIHYSINNGSYLEADMVKYEDTTNYTYTFKGLKPGDDVRYYIDANDEGGNYNIDPTCGKKDPHHFTIS